MFILRCSTTLVSTLFFGMWVIWEEIAKKTKFEMFEFQENSGILKHILRNTYIRNFRFSPISIGLKPIRMKNISTLSLSKFLEGADNILQDLTSFVRCVNVSRV